MNNRQKVSNVKTEWKHAHIAHGISSKCRRCLKLFLLLRTYSWVWFFQHFFHFIFCFSAYTVGVEKYWFYPEHSILHVSGKWAPTELKFPPESYSPITLSIVPLVRNVVALTRRTRRWRSKTIHFSEIFQYQNIKFHWSPKTGFVMILCRNWEILLTEIGSIAVTAGIYLLHSSDLWPNDSFLRFDNLWTARLIELISIPRLGLAKCYTLGFTWSSLFSSQYTGLWQTTLSSYATEGANFHTLQVLNLFDMFESYSGCNR